jgi:hypothetical protein
MSPTNSVFISYRREASAELALAIYQDLHYNGIDVFYDIEGIGTGRFDKAIFNEIVARPYFILVLTPGTLERCVSAEDWVRQEIEYALKLRREIVPLHTPTFSFADIDQYLPETVASELMHHNAIEVPHRQFRLVMADIRTRLLKPVSLPTTTTHKEKQAPDDSKSPASAAYKRALAKARQGELNGAIADFTEALRVDPKLVAAYYRRGLARYAKGDLQGAMVDFNTALLLNPQYAEVYNSRALARAECKNYAGAIADGRKFLDLQPKSADADELRENITVWEQKQEKK